MIKTFNAFINESRSYNYDVYNDDFYTQMEELSLECLAFIVAIVCQRGKNIELKKDRPFYFYDSNRELYKKNIKGFQVILHDDAVGKYDDENEYEYDDYNVVAIPSDDSEPIVLSENPDTCPCPFQTTVEIYDVINNKYNIL